MRSPLLAAALAASIVGCAVPACAATPPLRDAHVLTLLDLADGQQPENLTAEADGSIDLTMSFARQVDRLMPDGVLHVLATLPAPPDGTQTSRSGRCWSPTSSR
jgi:streptogramin lyase